MTTKLKNEDLKNGLSNSTTQSIGVSEGTGQNLIMENRTGHMRNNTQSNDVITVKVNPFNSMLTPAAYPLVTYGRSVPSDVAKAVLEVVKTDTDRDSGTLNELRNDPHPIINVYLYCLRGVQDAYMLSLKEINHNSLESLIDSLGVKLKSLVENVHFCSQSVIDPNTETNITLGECAGVPQDPETHITLGEYAGVPQDTNKEINKQTDKEVQI